jgi:hypothetical protein
MSLSGETFSGIESGEQRQSEFIHELSKILPVQMLSLYLKR